MAAPTIRQIREGMETRLATISGLRTFSYIPGTFSPPAAIVGMPRRAAQETFARGTDRYELSTWIVVSRLSDTHSEQNLEPYLNATGTKSVRAAVLGDKTLGGVVDDLHETSAEPVDFQFQDDGPVYLGLEFTYMILADGKD